MPSSTEAVLVITDAEGVYTHAGTGEIRRYVEGAIAAEQQVRPTAEEYWFAKLPSEVGFHRISRVDFVKTGVHVDSEGFPAATWYDVKMYDEQGNEVIKVDVEEFIN